MKRVPARLGAVLLLGAGAALAAPRGAGVEEQPPCDAWVVTYALTPGSTVVQTDTALHAGDGTFELGPGELELAFTNDHGRPGPGPATLRSVHARMDFNVTTSVLGMRTTVGVHATSSAAPDRCGIVASGVVDGGALAWSTPVHGYRTDGTVTCRGPLCGRFGMPREGETPLHVGPADVTFSALAFRGRHYRRLRMPPTLVSRTKKPRATTHIQLAARVVGRRCERAPACR